MSGPVADPNAAPYVLRDPIAPAVMEGTVHDVDFPIIEKDITVAEGFVVHAWTFGGTVPGPVIRVHLGDTVNVHLTNQGQMSHSIDFHASQTAMNSRPTPKSSKVTTPQGSAMMWRKPASTWLWPSWCCRPSPANVVRPAVAPTRKPRARLSQACQIWSPTRWKPNIE